MKKHVQIRYTETVYKTGTLLVDFDEVTEWLDGVEPTGADIKEFLESGDDDWQNDISRSRDAGPGEIELEEVILS